MSTSASTHPQPLASTETPENGTLSQIIRPLEPKSKLKSTAFNRVMQALTARDEAIRRETSYWKTQYEVMEKKHGEAALEKLIALDELAKCMRLLEKNQAPRAGTDQRVLIQRPGEDFNKAEKQNAKLSCKSENCKVSALESEKENAELSCKVSASESESEKEKAEEGDKRRFEELNGRVSSPRLPKPVYGPPSGPSVLDIFDRQHQLGKQLEAFQMEQREFRDETRNRFGRIDESLQNLTNYFSAYPPQTKTDKGSPVIIGIYDSDDEMPSRKRGSCNDDDDGLKPTKKCHSNSFQESLFTTAAFPTSTTMALRAATRKSAGKKMMSAFGPRRWAHAIAVQPPPLDSSMGHAAVTAPFVLPELDRDSVDNNGNAEYGFPSFSFGGGSMELMAVPKKKVSPHKRGIRNGPKALKPVPVIIRCKSCGRVKLPHFYCCSGDRGNTGELNSSSS
ncbi:hypothetical protein RHGRI_019941 [Rhododendron griersonianum]|uniref:Large ribosomal subunit protein bL32m n=1 Tax=Rhododendron griersonianum TaxID=479676 RepID=A0AAV6JHN2_9ERIC|nr:hypothetical protein RHGRI_019941 [Rhododendron griersonianum]